jgi:prevent-host-death family protein
MVHTETETLTMKFTDARQQLSQVVNRVARRQMRVLIEKSGVPVAAIVSADDLRRLEDWQEERDAFFEGLREMSRAFADVPPDELERQVALAIRQARAQLRAEREAVDA